MPTAYSPVIPSSRCRFSGLRRGKIQRNTILLPNRPEARGDPVITGRRQYDQGESTWKRHTQAGSCAGDTPLGENNLKKKGRGVLKSQKGKEKKKTYKVEGLLNPSQTADRAVT